MKNGTSFALFVAETRAFLESLTVADYYARPFPSDEDTRLTAVVSRFMAADKSDREQFLTSLPAAQRSLFGIFGHRAATLAARGEDTDLLLRGLVGLSIANVEIPERRRVEVALAVFHHVARKLSLNPVELFEEAAVFAAEPFATTLLTFGRRGDVRLASFGWREVKTTEGVRYKFDWA